MGAVRAGLCFQLKQQVGHANIMRREEVSKPLAAHSVAAHPVPHDS